MSDTFHKFLFLGVMITLVVFANHGTVAEQRSLNLTYGVNGGKVVAKAPPTFVLQPPGTTAFGDLAADVTANDLTKAATSTPATSSTLYDPNPSVPPTPFQNALLESSGDSSQSVFSKRGDEPVPNLAARIALLVDLTSGRQYVNFNAGSNWPLASLTKLMTAVTAFQELDLDRKATITVGAFATDTSDQILKIGNVYGITDLLRIMLLPSSNVGAEAIAESYGREQFIAAMNAQAQNWGMVNTHFDDPAGISVGSRSTGNDLLVLTKKIYEEYPRVFATTRVPSAYVAELTSQKRVLVKNINDFAGRADFLGGKTGHTDEASGNLLSVFSYGRKPVVIIVMGTEDRFGDTTKLLNWFEANYK